MTRRPTAEVGWALGVLAVGLVLLGVRERSRPWVEHQRAERALLVERLDELARLEATQAREATEALETPATTTNDSSRDKRVGSDGRQDETLFRLERRLRRARRAAEPDRRIDSREAEARSSETRSSKTRSSKTRPSKTQSSEMRRIEIESLEELVAERRRALGLEGAKPDLDLSSAAPGDDRKLEQRFERYRDRRLGRFDPRIGPRAVSPAASHASHGEPASLDRCATCHETVLEAALFEPISSDSGPSDSDSSVSDAAAMPRRPRALEAHAELLTPGSKLSWAAVGCTGCHGGNGLALDFTAAGHRPRDPEQAAWWRQEHGWTATPNRGAGSGTFASASILAGPLAPSLPFGSAPLQTAPLETTPPSTAGPTAGRLAMARFGCASCHAVGHDAVALGPERWAGPSLIDLGARLSPAAAAATLRDPAAARAIAFMPSFWPADESPEDRELEIAALVAALFPSAGAGGSTAAPKPAEGIRNRVGDRERGGARFAALGCRACHLLEDATRLASGPDAARLQERRRGPHLGDLGARRDARFVAAWLRAPRGRMPDLRLDARDTRDLAAFLTAPAAAIAFEAADPPAAAAVTARLREALLAEGTVEAADATLDRLDAAERLAALGDRLLDRYACGACHALPERGGRTADTSRDLALRHRGPDLRGVARRLDIPTPVGAWRPHAGLAAAPLLGDYRLQDREAEALLGELLSWRSDPPTPQTAPAAATVRAGGGQATVVMERLGCTACHRLGGAGGPARETLDPSPPRLDFAAAVARPDWLVDQLATPSAVSGDRRPWLEVRMPTFAFAPGEVETLISGLLAQGGQAVYEPAPRATDLEQRSGAVLFDVLHCRRCHLGAAVDLPGAEPAPRYAGAAERLRPQALDAYLRDPRAIDPEGSMPGLFADGTDARYLVDTLSLPFFASHRVRLRRLFRDDASLEAFLGDPDRIASALRAHLLSGTDPVPPLATEEPSKDPSE